MAIISGPTPGTSGSFSEEGWSSLIGAAVPDGVINHPNSTISLNKLAVSADSSILGVYVATGMASVLGQWMKNDATATVTVATADATNPRLDWIVVELDRATGLSTLNKVTGTPAGSPVLPALTRNASIWQIPLAQVRVEAAIGVIAAGKVTDYRLYAKAVNKDSATNGSNQTGISTSIIDMTGMSITRWCDGGFVTVDLQAIGYVGTASNWIASFLTITGPVASGPTQLGQNMMSGSATEPRSFGWTYPVGVLTAGLYTFKAQVAVSGGSGTVQGTHALSVSEIR